MSTAKDHSADRHLVDRCLARDNGAWNDLIAKYQPKLLFAIRKARVLLRNRPVRIKG